MQHVRGCANSTPLSVVQSEMPFNATWRLMNGPWCHLWQVQSLLMELCDETKIAELRLKVRSSEQTFLNTPVPSPWRMVITVAKLSKNDRITKRWKQSGVAIPQLT